MKCDKCDNEATVHEVTIKGGKRHEKHLCEACAKGEGMAPQVHTSLPALLTQYITSQSQAAESAATPAAVAAPVTVCPSCGTTYAHFRSAGLLGCAACYAAFEAQLGPLLARAHEGGTHHVGKTPRGPGAAPVEPASDPRRAERIAGLRKHLTDAVAAEQYEKAAKLRDELARLESIPAAAPTVPTPAQAPAAQPAQQKARKMERPPGGQSPSGPGAGGSGGPTP